MKFNIKFGRMKTETIVKGIMICIAVLIICRQIPFLSLFFQTGTEITPFNLVMIGSLIIEFILLRLFCEVIYNIVAAAKCIHRDKEDHDQNLQG